VYKLQLFKFFISEYGILGIGYSINCRTFSFLCLHTHISSWFLAVNDQAIRSQEAKAFPLDKDAWLLRVGISLDVNEAVLDLCFY